MIALANWNRLDTVADETGMDTWQLHTPATGYAVADPAAPFAVDNGAFSGFDGPAFERLLTAKLAAHRERCRFVAVPDVVGCAVGTRELFDDRKRLFPYLAGWPLAYVAQDGATGTVPWWSIRCLFIGGVDPWKESDECARLVRQAKVRDIWVHVGRLNDAARLRRFLELGADSFDGMCLTGRGRADQRLALGAEWTAWTGGPKPAPLFTGLAA